jgi:DNA ligase-1
MNEKEENNRLSYFSSFVQICESIRLTQSKNNKVQIISKYISNLNEDSLYIAILFFSGKIFPRGSTNNLNIGFRTILQSLFEISNLNYSDIKRIHLEHGDIGSIAEYAISKKQVVTLFDSIDNVSEHHQITLNYIHNQFKKIANLSGPNSINDKKNLLKGLLVRCSPLESKYLIKIITNEMRIGSYEGLVELAIAKAFSTDIKNIRQAILVSGNIAKVALFSKRNSIETMTIDPFVPMSFMLADVMFTGDEIIEYYKKPLLCEYKYDGIRVQLHKFGDKCKIFSRNLADISYAFPELIDSALQTELKKSIEIHQRDDIIQNKSITEYLIEKNDIEFILDGELIAFKNNKPLPFQELQKRLRKRNVHKDKILSSIPICYIVYDIMLFEKRQVINETLEYRKKILSQLLFKDSTIINAKSILISSAAEINGNFKQSKEQGYEGLVIKDPLSQYHPGKRGKYWIKLKEELDTIDTVIVMAEYGHGKRAGTFSDYTLAVKEFDDNFNNEETTFENQSSIFKNLKVIGKAYSGLSDKEIDDMTKKLKSLIIKEENGNRFIIKPKVILEVSFDTIQKSNRHDSGYALRFPRIKNIRLDKGLNDIDSLKKVKTIYENQFHVKNKDIKENNVK